MNDTESGEHQSYPHIYLPAKLMGSMAVGLTVIGGIEKLTPISEAATPTWIVAGCAAVGAIVSATYGLFVNRRP